jgi:MEDS: MEthanogen/methylotroph, DcmR Sensory domain
MATSHSVEFAGGTLARHHHICAFFHSADEEHRVLRWFIKDGFERGDKAFHLVNPELREEHLKRLAAAGINVQEAMKTGQLEVREWQGAQLRGGRFDQNAWLASLEEVLQSGTAAGYGRTRFLSHMEWALIDLPGVADLIEFETRVNLVAPKYDDILVCAYDLSKFRASVVMDALRTHPAVIIGGVLQQNPFFVPPEQFLEEIRKRRPARKSANAAN